MRSRDCREQDPTCFGRAPAPEEGKLEHLTQLGDHSRDSTQPPGIWQESSTHSGMMSADRQAVRPTTATLGQATHQMPCSKTPSAW